MREIHTQGFPDATQLPPPKEQSLVEAGHIGFLDMGARLTQDPTDTTGALLKAVVTHGDLPTHEAARVIVESKIQAGIPIERDGIFTTEQAVINLARSVEFFTLYGSADNQVTVGIHPEDAQVIREKIEEAIDNDMQMY